MSQKKLAVIKAGDTFPELVSEYGDFEDWIINGLDVGEGVCSVVDAQKQRLPDPGTIKGAVISGSHDMVTQDLDWSLALEAWARDMVAAGVPLLGICYGHQILGRAMGGQVDFHPKGLEIGTRDITCLPACTSDPLFKDLPGRFKVHVIHSQSVIRLPENALLLAENGFEPHQAFRIGKAAWGVQFHPEAFVDVTKEYIRSLADTVTKEGQNPETLIRELEETPWAAALLKGFGAFVTER